MGAINTGNITPLLREGIKNIFGQAEKAHISQWNMIFDEEKSNKAYEVDSQFEGLGLAPELPEGQGVQYDAQQSGYNPKYPNLTYALGFIVTKNAMRDNLYNLFPQKSKALSFSMNQTKEVVAANVLNRAFNSS